MHNKKISELPPLHPVDGTELVPVAYKGATYHISVKDIANQVDLGTLGVATKSDLANYVTVTDLAGDLSSKANITDIVSKTELDSRIADLLGSAPGNYTTLTQIAQEFAKDETGAVTTAATVAGIKTSVDTLNNNLGSLTSKAVAALAPLASPTFTGTVTFPTGGNVKGLVPADVGLAAYAGFPDPNLLPLSSATVSALSSKQATLISGTNIKTINNQSILASGNISVLTGIDSGTESNLNGMLRADGSLIQVATAGTHYQAPIGNVSGIVKGDGNGNYSAAVSATDIKTINSKTIIGPGDLSPTDLGVISAATISTMISSAASTATLNATQSSAVSAMISAQSAGALTAANVSTMIAAAALSTAQASAVDGKIAAASLNAAQVSAVNAAITSQTASMLTSAKLGTIDGTSLVIPSGNTSLDISTRSLNTKSPSGAYTLLPGDRGTRVTAAGNITIPASGFTNNDAVLVYNGTTAAIQIIAAAGVTAYLDGNSTASATANTTGLTLAAKGLAGIVFNSATEVVVSGKSIS